MPVNPELRANQSSPLQWAQMDNNLLGLAQLANATESANAQLAASIGQAAANQVHEQANKVTPDADDELFLTNSANGYQLSKLKWSSLVAALSSLPGTLDWGHIGGSLSTQTDLQAALNLKANTASPAFTGPISASGSVGVSGQVLTSRGPGLGSYWSTVSAGGSPTWGSILGTLADQSDLNTALSAKANSSALGSAAGLNVGTAANNVVQLNSLGYLPALDGRNLINLPGSGVSSFNTRTGTVTLTTADVLGALAATPLSLAYGGLGATTAAGGRTTLGLGTAAIQNVGAAAGNVVQLDSLGRLPALDGRNLTNLSAVAAGVSSFNTRTGTVTLNGTDVISALGFTPISGVSWGTIAGTLSSQSDLTTALAAKAPTANPTFTGTVTGITKAMVNLGNVDNTADINKPVSTSQQAALDAKVNLSGSYANPSWITSLASSKVLPSFAGQAGKILKVNSGATDVIWGTAGDAALAANQTWTGLDTFAAGLKVTGLIAGDSAGLRVNLLDSTLTASELDGIITVVESSTNAYQVGGNFHATSTSSVVSQTSWGCVTESWLLSSNPVPTSGLHFHVAGAEFMAGNTMPVNSDSAANYIWQAGVWLPIKDGPDVGYLGHANNSNQNSSAVYITGVTGRSAWQRGIFFPKNALMKTDYSFRDYWDGIRSTGEALAVGIDMTALSDCSFAGGMLGNIRSGVALPTNLPLTLSTDYVTAQIKFSGDGHITGWNNGSMKWGLNQTTGRFIQNGYNNYLDLAATDSSPLMSFTTGSRWFPVGGGALPTLGTYQGKIKVLLDGVAFYIPIYSGT